jgi:hypothetical protein
MTLLGIPDPWIWTGYILCFATVIFCCAYALLKKHDDDGEDDE